MGKLRAAPQALADLPLVAQRSLREAQPYAFKNYNFQRLLPTAGTEFQKLAAPLLQIACLPDKKIT